MSRCRTPVTRLSTKMSETKKILDAMKEMKESVNEKIDTNQNEVISKLSDMENRLASRLDDHANRLTDVENEARVNQNAIQSLTLQQKNYQIYYEKLLERVVANEAHQRRLNLKFHGITYDENENITEKFKNFLMTVLKMDPAWVAALKFRDLHRLAENKKKPGVRPLIVGFIFQDQRNEVYKKAYLLKNTDYVINVDLPRELTQLQNDLLAVRKEIRAKNPGALAFITYQSYRPVLRVKYEGKVQNFKNEMVLENLQPGDNRGRPGRSVVEDQQDGVFPTD